MNSVTKICDEKDVVYSLTPDEDSNLLKVTMLFRFPQVSTLIHFNIALSV